MLHHRDDLSLAEIPPAVPGPTSSCPTTSSLATARTASSSNSSLPSSGSALSTPLRERCGFNLTLQIPSVRSGPAPKGPLEPHISNLPRKRRTVVDSVTKGTF
ncbi:hypothetical protein GGX14DRAFT_475640 [Mycena pura]|uniref:Uncharacterized protein n=1 Tax=Mycena pura TaxID=153505 RepID=A0AAD6UYE5_9AGAR|nr:hypothetical protein GGX14DRAFT_475640 [Mycena pura]